MYAAFFGLRQEPFSIAPDPRFLFMSERHREALAHLLYGLRGGGGFVLLTGEIGAGKTTVCRCFLEQIPKRCNVAYIFNPKLSAEELLQSVCDEFRIPCEHAGPGTPTSKDHVDALNNFLLRTHAVGQNNVLIIDEAQNLSADVLEQLRLLTNLETNERKLLQIILIGQPELRSMLARPELEQLAQRVIARYHLEALSERESEQYIQHRLGVAGMSRALPFDDAAMRRIHRLSRGIPRRINLLCDRALLGAYASGRSTVDRKIVDRAALEVFGGDPGDRARSPAGRSAVWGVGAGMAAGAVAFTVMALAWDGGWRQGTGASAVVSKPAASKVLAFRPPNASSGPAAAPTAHASAAAASISATLPWSSLLHNEGDAWRELAQVWGATLPEGDPCQMAPRQQMQCFRSASSSLNSIRQLDRPGILTLQEEGAAKPVYALLIALSDNSATLRAAGVTQTVSLVALAGAWRGDFATLWRTPPGYDARGANEASTSAWLEAQLGKPASAAASSATLESLRSRVAAFQLGQGLKPDGVAGPMTLMQLNRVAGVAEPRLVH